MKKSPRRINSRSTMQLFFLFLTYVQEFAKEPCPKKLTPVQYFTSDLLKEPHQYYVLIYTQASISGLSSKIFMYSSSAHALECVSLISTYLIGSFER
jgi:hypothetical protein